MQADPDCPVCIGRDWQTIGARTYALADMPRLNAYHARRYRVLFEVWFPGDDAVRLQSKLCRCCGFITYTPRPTAQDVQAKYRYLSALGGGGADGPPPDSPGERRRAENIFRVMRPYLSSRDGTVLDFGGDDGRRRVSGHASALRFLDAFALSKPHLLATRRYWRHVVRALGGSRMRQWVVGAGRTGPAAARY